jgi:hypothetical protein
MPSHGLITQLNRKKQFSLIECFYFNKQQTPFARTIWSGEMWIGCGVHDGSFLSVLTLGGQTAPAGVRLPESLCEVEREKNGE